MKLKKAKLQKKNLKETWVDGSFGFSASALFIRLIRTFASPHALWYFRLVSRISFKIFVHGFCAASNKSIIFLCSTICLKFLKWKMKNEKLSIEMKYWVDLYRYIDVKMMDKLIYFKYILLWCERLSSIFWFVDTCCSSILFLLWNEHQCYIQLQSTVFSIQASLHSKNLNAKNHPFIWYVDMKFIVIDMRSNFITRFKGKT